MAKLRRISVIPLAKIFCVFHAVIGAVLGVIVTIGSITNQEEDGFWSLGAWSLLVFPVVNAGLGFLTGLFLAWVYNFFARRLGGIEYETDDKESLSLVNIPS